VKSINKDCNDLYIMAFCDPKHFVHCLVASMIPITPCYAVIDLHDPIETQSITVYSNLTHQSIVWDSLVSLMGAAMSSLYACGVSSFSFNNDVHFVGGCS